MNVFDGGYPMRDDRIDPDEQLPDLWFVKLAEDGEWTGPGDNPPGSPGDFYEVPTVVDIYGEIVCECYDTETARAIVEMHNGHAAQKARADLLEAALSALIGVGDYYPNWHAWGYKVGGFGYRCRYCPSYSSHPKRGETPHADGCPVAVALALLEGDE